MEKQVFVCKDTIFYNSQCLFIEYQDIIKMPMFVILIAIKDNKNMNKIFNLDIFKQYDLPSLFEWYINRKHINFFCDIPLRVSSDDIDDNFYDKILNDYLNLTEEFYITNSELNFSNILKIIMEQKDLIKKVIVYNEGHNQFIKNDILNLYGNSVLYLEGNFREVISSIPSDSTFVFSDINKINIMAELDLLNYTSILVPMGYRYNQIDSKNYKVDFEDLSKKFIFKYSFFDNTSI